MAELLTPSDIERLAKASKKSIAEVCREAQVAQSTFFRWKVKGSSPRLDVYQRICAAVATPPKSDAA